MEKPQARMAFRWLQGEELDPELVEKQIERALLARPLYPDNWLLAARVKYRLGKLDEATRLAEHAHSLGPTRAHLLWDLAMFWMGFPDQHKTIALLHDYLLAAPQNVRKVVFVAYRLEQDKAALLTKLIPEQLAPGYDMDEDYYAARLLRTALRLNNPEMADLAWQRFKIRLIEDNPNATVIKSYLHFLIAQNDKVAAFNLWQQTQTQRMPAEGLMNPSFENELLGYGFGWRVRPTKGVTFERSFEQSVDGNFSLKISFDGSRNINLYRSHITIPVEGGVRYILSVYWMGENITTRSNPFFQIVYKQNKKTKVVRRSQPERGSWSWRRVDMEFETPEEVNFILFSVRRWPTQALDKLISGNLYIDGVHLTRIE